MARTRQDALLGLVSQMSGGSRRGTTISQYLKAISKDEETHLVVIVDQNNTPTDFYSAIQPDYAQADEEALDFIKNKPDLTIFYSEGEVLENRLTLRKPNGDFLEYEPVIPAAMTYMGSCLQADLPTTGQTNGDYGKLADAEGQYAGQCAIGNSTNNNWDYSSSNITVEPTVQEGSTNAVSSGGVYSYITNLLQAFYDGILPVGSIWTGFGAPGVPDGITATGTDVSSQFENRYFKVSSTSSVGTSEGEELPNIQGLVGYYYGTTEVKYGALDASYSGQYWSKAQKTADGDYNNAIVFNASMGQTNAPGGGFVPQAQSVYKDGGKVKPLTTTIKVYRRTA